MFKVVEAFSGIGAQAKALGKLKKELDIEYDIVHTCDWDIAAIIAYNRMHNSFAEDNLYYELSDEEIDTFLKKSTLSINGKEPISEHSYARLGSSFKRVLYSAIKDTRNLISITDVKGSDMPGDIDLLTYSFPCQDLSMCGYWHGNKSGISRNAHNRSGMLWEVERILMEMHETDKNLPKFLLMENVTNILSKTHRDDFEDWKKTLKELGYYNKVYKLNARNFGVPQKRERAYMLSIQYGDSKEKMHKLDQYFCCNNLENPDISKLYSARTFSLENVLKLDYTNMVYRREADAAQPNNTPSRQKIWRENDILFYENKINNICVNTVTTKQDRNPNSGLITYKNGKEGKAEWRYLTPRECFILMGFDESDYSKIIENDLEYKTNKILFTNEKLIRMAGNSICVDVLEAIFKQVFEIQKILQD